MANSGKSLDELVKEVYDIVGAFAFERVDLHIDNQKKLSIIKACQENQFQEFGKYKIKRIETIDGFKFFFDEDTWLMIRPSGTEPVLRTYAEAPTQEMALDILRQVKDVIV